MSNPVVAAVPAAGVGFITSLPSRQLAGADVHGRLLLPPFSAFIYYSHSFLNDDALGNRFANGTVAADGDIAPDKVWAGLTLELGSFAGTLLTRWITDRPVVPSNPTGTVNWYALLDANLLFTDLFDTGLWAGLRMTNILGTTFQQPGVQAANSGNPAGASAGLYNSQLPQPGRAFFATAGFVLDPEPERRPHR